MESIRRYVGQYFTPWRRNIYGPSTLLIKQEFQDSLSIFIFIFPLHFGLNASQVFQVFGSVGSWLVLSVYLTTPSPTEFQRKPKANLPYNLDPNQTPFTDYFSGKLAGKKNPKISDLVTGGDYFLQAEMRKEEVVIPVLASLVGLFLLIAVALFWIIKSRRKLAQNSRLVPVEVKRRRFSHPQIVKMTHDFRRVIGRGGFGTVFHGHLDDAPVAVKMYCNRNRNVHPGFQTEACKLILLYSFNFFFIIIYVV